MHLVHTNICTIYVTYAITKTVWTERFKVNNHNDSLCSCIPEDETKSSNALTAL